MRIFNKIKNLIRWFPIIWNDYDWDYFYLLKILRFKLQNMEKYFNNNKLYLSDSNIIIKRIKVCRILLDRIIEDNYFPTCFWDKWENVLFKTNNKELQADLKKCTEYEYKMMLQDYEYLFILLSKHIRTWWD